MHSHRWACWAEAERFSHHRSALDACEMTAANQYYAGLFLISQGFEASESVDQVRLVHERADGLRFLDGPTRQISSR